MELKYGHAMIDLETCGKRSGCVPLSIGGVAFDEQHGVGRPFFVVINTRSCVERYGLHQDEETMLWWRGQSDDARKVLGEAETSPIGMKDALSQLTAWFKPFDPWRVKVWAQGQDFDLAILRHCYALVDRDIPWKYWNGRDLRTLKDLAGAGKKNRNEIRHNALQDATDQAHEAIAMMKKLKGELAL